MLMSNGNTGKEADRKSGCDAQNTRPKKSRYIYYKIKTHEC